MSTAPKTKKPKRGRPPSPDREQTWFRSTPAEKARWEWAAKRLKVPLRVWIRLQLNAAAEAASSKKKEAETDG